MDMKKFKTRVFEANMDLPKYGLVTFTWGNVSEIDRDLGLIAIKPSGVSYNSMKVDDIVILDLEGNTIEGALRPSSDTPTHIELYRSFKDIGGVVHTHSSWATSWAQSGKDLPCYGTTHADYFSETIPCTRELSILEVEEAYELNTGKVIVETFKKKNIDPIAVPGVLVFHHAPFTWGKNADEAVHNAVVLDEVAKMTFRTLQLENNALPTPNYILKKHYLRKHGENAYYGQD